MCNYNYSCTNIVFFILVRLSSFSIKWFYIFFEGNLNLNHVFIECIFKLLASDKMHQCFKMFNQCFSLCLNHSRPWSVSSPFKFDCVAGIQFYLKVVLCWIFSHPTATLSEAGHTNDCQQLKLACILSGYEGDWLAWNPPEGSDNFQAINSSLPPIEKIRRWSLRLWQQNKNTVQLFCKFWLYFSPILLLFLNCIPWNKRAWNI